MSLAEAVIVTSCTARKRGVQRPLSLDRSMMGPSLVSTAERWRDALRQQRLRVAAGDLYAGRSFVEARRTATSVGGLLFVVSAGLGLVAADEQVPAYDLTAASKEGGLNGALEVHSATAAEWWTVLCGGNGLTQLLRQHPNAVVLMALPSSYIRMVSADLASASSEDAARLRILTSSAGRKELPEVAAMAALPYDERLESIPQYAGTRADFPQRALRHFVETVNGHRHSLEAGRQLVEKALANRSAPRAPQRTRISDGGLKELIRANWTRYDGQSAKLLRFLRDDALVACEQGRFAYLWRSIREEQGVAATSGTREIADVD